TTGIAQLARLEDRSQLRDQNADYLRDRLEQLPGIVPHKLSPSVTKAAYHLFPSRYQRQEFKGLPREKFLEALRAEGVPCSRGYDELNKRDFLRNVLNSPNFKKFYPGERLNYERYTAENECPQNEKLCNEEAVWFTQNLLLGSRNDMDLIASAIGKIRKNAEKLK